MSSESKVPRQDPETTDRIESGTLHADDSRPQKRIFPKWRRTLLLWFGAAVAIFITNLVFSVWAYVKAENDDLLLPFNRNLYEGSCAKTRSINSGLHFLINILGTILLAGSNYCMQCLLAPTRKEVDAAHAKRLSLDIGVLSLRNLGRISKFRLLLWLLLGISSLSLHLL
jgi:hypothetical protein